MSASIVDLELELRELRVAFERTLSETGKDDDALEEKVWAFYSRLERIAAIMKLRLSVEEPPHLIATTSERSPEVLLHAALGHMKEADDRIHSDDHSSVLESAQAARNSLRWYLSEKRRVRTNEARSRSRASRSRPPSSS
jgi:hypothetical protein